MARLFGESFLTINPQVLKDMRPNTQRAHHGQARRHQNARHEPQHEISHQLLRSLRQPRRIQQLHRADRHEPVADEGGETEADAFGCPQIDESGFGREAAVKDGEDDVERLKGTSGNGVHGGITCWGFKRKIPTECRDWEAIILPIPAALADGASQSNLEQWIVVRYPFCCEYVYIYM